jgi:hypothetical protein
MDVKNLSMTTTVENNKNLFEKVAKDYNKAKDAFRTQYSILNYDKIIDELISYLDGYKKYNEEGSEKFKGKVLTISRNFFDKMFTDKEYRIKINLSEFRELNLNYLKRTKQLQSIVESTLKDAKANGELNSLVRMIDNQFKKLAKVNKDDMKIYLWIVNADSKVFGFNLDDKTRKAYYDKMSPVMHKVVRK